VNAHGGENKLKNLTAFTLKLRDDKPAGKAGTMEYFVEDYKEFNGIMVAGRTTDSRDVDLERTKARMSSTHELVEFKAVDKLNAKLFAEP
jgi:hypothetical protein